MTLKQIISNFDKKITTFAVRIKANRLKILVFTSIIFLSIIFLTITNLLNSIEKKTRIILIKLQAPVSLRVY